jgi:threonine synthase
VQHISTRGEAPAIGFIEALLAGLARDGGLYVPQSWPRFTQAAMTALSGKPFARVAETLIGALADGEIETAVLRGVVDHAYGAFEHEAVCPLVQIGDNLFVLELFHGPTLAFKDVAMRFLAGMMNHELARRGERATIIGATSGDTGSAAIDAFQGSPQVDVFILYPHGRVSEVQRRQMTTAKAENVHAIAIEGTFDDCQAIVKGLFNHHAFREEVRLSGVNSINWARIVAQVTYYFTAALSLGAPYRPVSFTVPTGNFGNILAGWVARAMGLPVAALHVATNENDILARVLGAGSGELGLVQPTSSPSMDIQVSSNFERVIFDASGRDAQATRRIMLNLAQARRYALDQPVLERLRAAFSAARTNEAETAETIRLVHARSGYLLDPHTAVGVHAARARLDNDPATPMVVLGTAHPAKFPDAVEKASGIRPALPARLADLLERPERISVLPNDQGAVERFIRAHGRIVSGRAA